MRFLADENFPRAAVAALEAAGHDVVWIRIAAPGITDAGVSARAIGDGGILLTFDKDFGELAARSVPEPSCGVVLFRVLVPKSEDAGRRLAARVTARQDWAGHFSVIESARVRMRPLA